MEGTAPVEILGATVSPALLPHHLPFEAHCITVASWAPECAAVGIPHDLPILIGVFRSQEQLNSLLWADGSTSRIHIVALPIARRLFARLGGGQLEEGPYLLHPKRDTTLVPLATFHSDMLQEMTKEIRSAMGRLGAKRLVVETIEGVTFGGGVVSRVPTKSGAVSLEVDSRDERTLTYEWGSSTFQPEEALSGCVWIQDNPAAMTIVDQRRSSDLVRFEEVSRADTRFSVSLDVMCMFKANFAWASESTFRYVVEFFPRPGR
jgi:hypothetical protein